MEENIEDGDDNLNRRGKRDSWSSYGNEEDLMLGETVNI